MQVRLAPPPPPLPQEGEAEGARCVAWSGEPDGDAIYRIGLRFHTPIIAGQSAEYCRSSARACSRSRKTPCILLRCDAQLNRSGQKTAAQGLVMRDERLKRR